MQKKETKEDIELAPALIPIHGTVRPPSGVSPDSLEIVSLLRTSKPDKEGKFSIPSYKDGVNTVAAMAPEKEFGLMKILIMNNGASSEETVLDSQSTAQALIFITPVLIANDPKRAQEIMEIIKKNQKVQEFAGVIDKVFEKDDPMSIPEYEEAFQAALSSVLLEFNPQ